MKVEFIVHWTKRLLVPGLLCLLALPALWIDVPVARLARAEAFPGALRELFENLEPFGHGAVVIVIAAVICCLDRGRRWKHTTGALLAALGAGLAANLLKLIVLRERPWNIAADAVTGLDTFGGLLPSLTVSAQGQSFPSAHSATAMGLAVVLASCYPRGRMIFYMLAAATAVSRVIAASHYVSDTLVGLALGLIVGDALVRSAWFAAGADAGVAQGIATSRDTASGDTTHRELPRIVDRVAG